jgi:hypothetical protein
LKTSLDLVSMVAPTNSSTLILGETGTGKDLDSTCTSIAVRFALKTMRLCEGALDSLVPDASQETQDYLDPSPDVLGNNCRPTLIPKLAVCHAGIYRELSIVFVEAHGPALA